jgi:hypothetical protein
MPKGRLVIDDLTGGRNGYDPPEALAKNECADAVNVDWFRSPFGRKRNGGTDVDLTFSSGGPFGGPIWTLQKFVPASNLGNAELWAFDNTGIVGRLKGGILWVVPTFKDAPTATASGLGVDIEGANINNKLALAYQSAVARMHGWDPGVSASVRRFGLAATVAPTAANGGGAGTAVLRYYRQRSTVQVAGITIRRSEPSASVAFTPGANGVTVTQAAVINEGETHWEVEASVDGITFYRIATVAIATTTYLDNAATTTYNANPLSAITGTYTLQKPYKFIAADQNRMLGFGSWTSTDKQSRIEFSAVIGSLDVGDEERVDTTTNYYIDLDEADSGAASGLAGPVLGSFFAFKFYQIWRLTATGTPSQPFRADAISKNVGAITQRAIVVGEDENGDPCLYFMSHRGPYRWGTNGLDYIGKGVEDLILGPTSTIYVTGQDNRLAHCIYHRDKRQVWFWVTTASGAFTGSRACLIYHIPTNSWSRFLGNDSGTFPNSIEKQGASMMFANTVGSVMSMDNKPYGSYVGGAGAKIIKWDDSTSTTDVGDQFQGYVRTRAYEVGGPSQDAEVTDAQLVGVGSSQINVLTVPDFGASPSKGGTAFSFAPVGSEPRVIRRAEDTTLSGAQFYQWLVGDYPSPSVATWNIDRLVVGTKSHESLI